MKQVLSIILLLMLNIKIAAQYQDNNNRFNEEQNINNINSFQQSEESEQESEQADIPNEEPQKGIGNPGEPAPINQYTLVLLGFAIVGILLMRKKINIQEQN